MNTRTRFTGSGIAAYLVAIALLATVQPHARAETPSPGDHAPDFTLKDANGKDYTLSALRGKYVVLEWINFGCPFVKKHYDSGNMSSLQKSYRDRGVIWLSICSSAPGKQGYFEGGELKQQLETHKAAPSAYLIDSDGRVGRLYAARTTPTMFVIDPKGTLVYGGAIDNVPSTDVDDIAEARNYVKEALDLSMAGKKVEIGSSKSYGCSVKY